ncbi:MAG: substrate-binding domain-containing protein, partial [Desulfuromonadales bacterium]|nr:substrate-binding domain-containing protein [Desulfuromonadales bacterium]
MLVAPCAAAGESAAGDHPAFGDSTYIKAMPEPWLAQEVTPPAHVGTADVFMTIPYHLYDLLAPKVETFAQQQNLVVKTKRVSCSTSSLMLLRKEVDIAGFCCTPSDNDRLPGVKFHTVAIAPVAILLNEQNSVNNLSPDQIERVFRGEIVNWAQLGGADLLIQPVVRMHCRTRPGRWRPYGDPEELSPNVISVGAINDDLEFIARTTGSIGYEPLPG